MNDAAPFASANVAPPPRWQFSLRALFVVTAIVAAFLALLLAGLWLFVVEIVLVAIIGTAFFIGTRRSLRKPTPPNVSGTICLLAGIGVACTASSLWFAGDPLVRATMVIGATVAAIGGYLAAVDASGRISESRVPASWRYLYSSAVAVLLVGWGTLHSLEKWYDTQAHRHARRIEERGLYWSWGKSSTYSIGPLRLFKFWTLAVYDRGPRSQGRRATNADVEAVASIDLVNALELADSQITDAGLAHLKSLHNLQSLDVRGTQVTARAIDELRQSLPNLIEIKH